jgi:hypothetical protein
MKAELEETSRSQTCACFEVVKRTHPGSAQGLTCSRRSETRPGEACDPGRAAMMAASLLAANEMLDAAQS